MRKQIGLFAGIALILVSAFLIGHYSKMPACLFIESKPDAVMVKGLDKVRVSIEDQRSHPGIVVGGPFTDVPKTYPFAPMLPRGDEHLIPPPPVDERAPRWVTPKRIDV